MHSRIIIGAFKKAKEKLESRGEINPSKNRKAKFLSNYIEEEEDFPYHSKSFNNLKSKVDGGNEKVIIKQPEVLRGLCIFLGYKNYEDYLLNNRENKDENGKDILVPINTADIQIKKELDKGFSIAVKLFLLMSTLLIVVVVITSINKHRWMVWENNHYIEVSFDTDKYSVGQLKLYKKDRVESFRRLKPNCETVFFNSDSSVNLWYGKNAEKELEYFTSYGLHPETGKTLKPITQYMIEKYICKPSSK